MNSASSLVDWPIFSLNLSVEDLYADLRILAEEIERELGEEQARPFVALIGSTIKAR